MNAAPTLDLRAIARTGPIHFVGISGAGMSALAELILRSGGQVTGCDLRPGAAGAALRERGADVRHGHDPSHAAGAVAVIATAAVPTDHPEIVAARALGIPVLKRAEALGALVNHGTLVAVAGTHGKTTTTAMTTAILESAGLDPTAFVGGRVAAWNGGLRLGSESLFVVEADEYDRSFHTLRPTIALVTTVEPDHLDVFGTPAAVDEAFRTFLEPVPDDGLIIACVDDDGADRLLRAVRGSPVSGYGFSGRASLRGEDLTPTARGSRFTVVEEGRELGELAVGSPGIHNARNALGSFAAARHLGADLATARRALEGFTGVDRRFQELGEARGVTVVDDYAHHPTEIRMTLDAARGRYAGRRIVAVFQPHLYSRTRDFAEDFGRALGDADVAWITDVYPAREKPIPGVSGASIADPARRGGAHVVYHPEAESLTEALLEELREGDVLLTMGAGDIDDTARIVLSRLGTEAGRLEEKEGS